VTSRVLLNDEARLHAKPEYISPYLDVALECFGPDWLMIGSDWPVCAAAASYSQVMNLVIDYLSRYPDSLRDAVLGRNAEKFWKLTSNLRDSHRVP
jgi:L-fuconolactonase